MHLATYVWPFDAALKVLQIEREKKKAEEEEQAMEEMDDSTRASDTDQDQTMADVAGQPQATVKKVDDIKTLVDDAFKILVRNATEEFGFIPRDVYRGVFDLPSTMDQHAAAAKQLHYSDLKKLVGAFSMDRELHGSSHKVVAVCPYPSSVKFDGWTINFKSLRIRERVMGSMRLEEDAHIRETYAFLHKIPEGSTLAGWFFEAIAHRVLSSGLSEGPELQIIRMTSNRANPRTCKSPPTFFTPTPGTPTPDTPPLPPAPLAAGVGVVTRVNFADRHLSNDVTLGNDKYYIPTAVNNALFDSFAINLDADRHTIVISIFQITTSRSHKGSTKGYSSIRKIMARVRELLKKESRNDKIEVAYILVCPDDGSQYRWTMPASWDDAVTRNDHRGNAFCIRVPVQKLGSASCLFTPNFAT